LSTKQLFGNVTADRRRLTAIQKKFYNEHARKFISPPLAFDSPGPGLLDLTVPTTFHTGVIACVSTYSLFCSIFLEKLTTVTISCTCR